MATYNDLAFEHYYLVKEKETSDITLLQTVMETSKCVLVLQIDEVDMTYWKKKDEPVFEIIEELTEEQVAEYDTLFEDEDEEAWDIEEPDYEFDDEEEPGDEELLDKDEE
ncbi:MAG TPA: hypothetical protein VHB48_06950 [Chitinophagaceae bacterium]|jgi:hypothetical protein|nr:hypothetical protein [Chitinophagaceae bacterium]